jgi:hypothetical protein
MSGFIYSGGFLPYCIKTLNEDGKPFQKWDGSTYDDTTGLPADSDGNTVYGDKSIYCIKLSLSQLMDLFWSARSIKIKSDVTGNGSMSASVSKVSSQKSISISSSDESKMYPDPWLWGRSFYYDGIVNKPSDLTKQVCYPSLSFQVQKGVDGTFNSDGFPSSEESGVTISPGRYSKMVYDSKDDIPRAYCGYLGGSYSCGPCPGGIQEVGRCSVNGSISVTHSVGGLDVIRVTNSSGKHEYWIRPFFGINASLSLNSGSDHSRSYFENTTNCIRISEYEELCECEFNIYATEEGAYGPDAYYRRQATAKRDVSIEAPYYADVSKNADPRPDYGFGGDQSYKNQSGSVTFEIKFKDGSTASGIVNCIIGSGKFGYDNNGVGGNCKSEGDLRLTKVTAIVGDTLDYSAA